MKITINRFLKGSSLLMLGILIGAALMNLLDMYVRSTYRDVIRIELSTEQEFLAARAAREHNLIRTVTHRWNAVDTAAGNGFRAFRKETALKEDKQFFLPIALLAHKFMRDRAYEKAQKSIGIDEGIKRGQLAVALEALGEKDEAAKQWDLAKALTGMTDLDHVKRLVFGLIDQENSKLHLEAERVILGDMP